MAQLSNVPGSIGWCWRCEAEAVLVHDPMTSRRDTLGICEPCSNERLSLMRRYVTLGMAITPAEVEGDRVKG